MVLHPTATVFGAYGHTGRFIVAELRKRGWGLILAGRDAAKLSAPRFPPRSLRKPPNAS